MGKYPQSNIHEVFSDFHSKKVKHDGGTMLTDIDRLWVRVDTGEWVCAFDLKWSNSGDGVTYAEEVAIGYLEMLGPYFIVEMAPRVSYEQGQTYEDVKEFKVTHWRTKTLVGTFNCDKFVDWLNNLYENVKPYKGGNEVKDEIVTKSTIRALRSLLNKKDDLLNKKVEEIKRLKNKEEKD